MYRFTNEQRDFLRHFLGYIDASEAHRVASYMSELKPTDAHVEYWLKLTQILESGNKMNVPTPETRAVMERTIERIRAAATRMCKQLWLMQNTLADLKLRVLETETSEEFEELRYELFEQHRKQYAEWASEDVMPMIAYLDPERPAAQR
jgi:hypothetical protein